MWLLSFSHKSNKIFEIDGFKTSCMVFYGKFSQDREIIEMSFQKMF